MSKIIVFSCHLQYAHVKGNSRLAFLERVDWAVPSCTRLKMTRFAVGDVAINCGFMKSLDGEEYNGAIKFLSHKPVEQFDTHDDKYP
jgi:hypothetical protein